MEIKRCIMTNSTCYKEGQTFDKHVGIVVHSTGANNPNIARYVQPSPDDPAKAEILADIGKNPYNNDWNHTDVRKGVHCFIGKNAYGIVECYQVLPWDKEAWGVWKGKMFRAGSPCYAEYERRTIVAYTDKDIMLPNDVYFELSNKGIAKWTYNGRTVYIDSFGLRGYNDDPPYFQFEICEDDLKSEEYFYDCMKCAQELCAYLCKTYDISVDKVVSHWESWEQGYGSQHVDPHNWLEKFGKDMNWFREKVAEKMGKVTVFKRGDKVKLLSNKAIDGTEIWDVVLDGRPLWVVASDVERTAVTINEDLTGITAWMHTYDVAYYDEPKPEPTPEPTPEPNPNPVIDNEKLNQIADELIGISDKFIEIAKILKEAE